MTKRSPVCPVATGVALILVVGCPQAFGVGESPGAVGQPPGVSSASAEPARPKRSGTRRQFNLRGDTVGVVLEYLSPTLTPEGLRQETLETARQLMKDFPGQTDPLGLMGTAHFQLGNTAEAATWWQRVLARNPKRADAYLGMAGIAMKAGEYEKVAGLCRKAIEIAPRLPGVHHRLAEALLELAKPKEAIAEAEQEVAIRPDDGGAYYLLGQAWFHLKEYEKAVSCYEKTLQLQPKASAACYRLSLAYARLGDAEKARTYREKFQAFREDIVDSSRARIMKISDVSQIATIASRIHTDAATVYRTEGWIPTAEAHWQRAAALDTRNPVCRRRLVELYMRFGRLTEAAALAEQLRQIDPENATYHLNTGVIYAGLRRFDAAEAALRRAVDLAPEKAAALRTLVGVLVHGTGKGADAKALARRLVDLEPTAPNYLLLGQACETDGDLPGALAATRRAAELAPDHQGVKAVLERLQQKE